MVKATRDASKCTEAPTAKMVGELLRRKARGRLNWKISLKGGIPASVGCSTHWATRTLGTSSQMSWLSNVPASQKSWVRISLFTTIACNLAIWLANLPLSIRVYRQRWTTFDLLRSHVNFSGVYKRQLLKLSEISARMISLFRLFRLSTFWMDNRDLKHARFLDADGNRKWPDFPFNLSSLNHIYSAKYMYLFSIRDD